MVSGIPQRAWRIAAAVSALLLVAGACGGSNAAPQAQPAASTPTPDVAPPTGTTPTVEPTEDIPPELPFSDRPVVLEGATSVLASAGEELNLDYLLHNPTALRQRYALRVSTNAELTTPALSASSLRVESREVTNVELDYIVPINAEVGDVIELTVLVANTADVDLRDTVVTTVTIVDSDGQRPVAGDDRISTTANELVQAYVIGNDSDPDGNIVWTSASMVTGGFRAAAASVNSNGTIAYEPFANVEGRDMLLYEICDTDGRCDTSIVTVTILAE